jgi:predicted N-acetyltransferase YhbS
LVIRAERPQDRAAAVEVERLAFWHGRDGSPADDMRVIVEALRDEDGSFAFVAQAGDRIIGHVQFSRGWIGSDPVVTLGPVGVLPEHQGRGIGSALIRAGLDEASRRGELAAILLGAPQYYMRFGFRPGSDLGLQNPATGVTATGFEILEEHFMILCLAADSARFARLSGDVRWHPSLK